MDKIDCYNNVEIRDILGDYKYHVFKITGKYNYSEKQRKKYEESYKNFDHNYNYYYRLSFVDEALENPTVNTTFYQPLTKAITNSIINFKIENNICCSNKINYNIKIVLDQYNHYSVEVISYVASNKIKDVSKAPRNKTNKQSEITEKTKENMLLESNPTKSTKKDKFKFDYKKFIKQLILDGIFDISDFDISDFDDSGLDSDSIRDSADFDDNILFQILDDGEYHEFKILKKYKYTKEQKKGIYKIYKKDYDCDHYYRLSFVNEEGKEKTVDTTFKPEISKAISQKLSSKDNIYYIIKMAYYDSMPLMELEPRPKARFGLQMNMLLKL